jgi:uncharacterized protein
MLIRFEAGNHRSIKAPVELSMVAVDRDRPSVRHFDRLPEGLLPVAGIFGPNASGKSNVLDALAWLSHAVGNSLRRWDDSVPRDAFRFDQFAEKSSTYEIDLMVTGVRHAYHLEVDDTQVLYEELISYPQKRPRTLFAREGLNLHIRRGLGGLAGTRDLLTPSTLALSAAGRFGAPEIDPVLREIVGMRGHGATGGSLRASGQYPVRAWMDRLQSQTRRLFLDLRPEVERVERPGAEINKSGETTRALELLRFADLGIKDVEVIEVVEVTERGDLSDQRVRRDLQLIHRAGGESVPFRLAEESKGTQIWFQLIGPVLSSLRTGRVLLFDEVDASLHPQLSEKLLNLFRDPETNPQGAQLIFTAHDMSLMRELNRDELWLTEKASDGGTTLTAVAEFGGDAVRQSANLERAYQRGRFGAIPDLDMHKLKTVLSSGKEESRGSA